MKKLLPFIIISILFSSCRTNLVYIRVQEPAVVTLPAGIKKVGIVNRSLASNESKTLDKIEQVTSLEGKDLDKEGGVSAIEGLKNELTKNDRFTEVKILSSMNLKTIGAGVFPTQLPWDTVAKLCKDNGVDAIFALEMFDTDSKIDYSQQNTTMATPLGNIPAIEHHATMTTTVKTGWRIYDLASRTVVDECPISKSIQSSGKGINPVAAAAALMGRKDAVKQTANVVGQVYAQRIIPYWVRVTRDYFIRGTGNFKIAKRKARSGNWDGAAELWQKETTNPKRKVAGRAYYNMAIINEINGNLDEAIKWAQQSYENYNNRLALQYVNILKDRANRIALLKVQEDNKK